MRILLVLQLDELIEKIEELQDSDYHKRIEDEDYNYLTNQADSICWVLNN